MVVAPSAKMSAAASLGEEGAAAAAERGPGILNVCFLADDSTAARWWLSLLQQSPGINLKCLWAKHRNDALALLRSAEAHGLPADNVTWSVGGEKSTRQRSLVKIAQDKAYDALIVAITPGHHADVLEVVFSESQGRKKHVFSCTPPTFNAKRVRKLLGLRQRAGCACGLWSVCSAFKHEVAATKAKAILLDLGQLVAAQVSCNSITQNQAVVECGSASTLLRVGNMEELMSGSCCSWVSLLRELFGEVSSLSCVQSADSGTVAGRLHFEGGPCVSLLLDLNTLVSGFEFIAWGTKGYAKMCWDAERKAFEVHRFLQHYEHPTLHPVTGPTYALKDWVHAIFRGASSPREQSTGYGPDSSAESFLQDLLVSESLLRSQGNSTTTKLGSPGVKDSMRMREPAAAAPQCY